MPKTDFEDAVAEAHTALVEAGLTWAQPRTLTEIEKLEAARLPMEWISARAGKPLIEQRLVRIRRIDHLAVRFASLEMMRTHPIFRAKAIAEAFRDE